MMGVKVAVLVLAQRKKDEMKNGGQVDGDGRTEQPNEGTGTKKAKGSGRERKKQTSKQKGLVTEIRHKYITNKTKWIN